MNTRFKRASAVAIVAAIASTLGMTGGLSACATIIHSGHQDVGIQSLPTGATVSIDNADKGKTPIVAKLSRKDTHIVRVEMPGYRPFEATITRKVSGWVWGNLVFGGLVGLAVDAISGGMYSLTPQQMSATLASGQASIAAKEDGLYVVAVLSPQSDWMKIGQLERE